MSDAADSLPGQLDVDEVLELVVRDKRQPARESVRGELVAPADDLVERFTATLVARPQTQRTYALACVCFVRWLGPLAGSEDLRRRTWPPTTPISSPAAARAPRSGKDCAALNTLLLWLSDHELLPAAQVREALAVRLPNARRSSRDRRRRRPAGQY